MLDFYRRVWQAFLAGFLVALGLCVQVIIYLTDKWYMSVLFISLAILALICLIVALIGLYFDYRDARKKNREGKREADHKALVESFKRLGLTEEQAEIAAKGR
jgi:heme/copper-type cytochrome/quinol oxidase subunit 2